jgi:hypothetical protein
MLCGREQGCQTRTKLASRSAGLIDVSQCLLRFLSDPRLGMVQQGLDARASRLDPQLSGRPTLLPSDPMGRACFHARFFDQTL